jgi:cation transport ATPase
VQSVEAAAVEKAELQVFAEKLADRLVGRTLLLAGAGAAITRNIDAGVAIVVADYGLAARVGVPSAVMGAVLRASRAGILIKGPRVVERLARVDTAVFDKTGTLTLGAPQVTRVVAYRPIEEPDEILRLAAAAERGLPHPVARAVMRAAAVRGITAPPAAEGELRVGLGVEVIVDGVRVQVGSRRFMEANEISLGAAARDERAAHERGGSVSFLAQNGRLAGMIVLEDELRSDAQEAVKALRSRRMRNVIMVSGDHREPTQAMAAALGIRHYYPELLPEDKAKLVRELRKEGRVVAMIGDGVNDAPALREADVGIAVQGGVPVAAETAGVVLTRGGLEKVVEALDLARGGIAAVDRALNAAVKGNIAAIGLASIGLGGPFTSILVGHGAAVAGAFSTLPRPRITRRGPRRHPSDPTAQ